MTYTDPQRPTLAALQTQIDRNGSLNLSGTAITALPDNLTVGGSLYLSGTAITALPDNLTVGGWLDLSSTAITALPDNLTVGGGLDLSGNGVTYRVTMSQRSINIGCESHQIQFWRHLDDRGAARMDGKSAIKWWAAWGTELLRWHGVKFPAHQAAA